MTPGEDRPAACRGLPPWRARSRQHSARQPRHRPRLGQIFARDRLRAAPLRTYAAGAWRPAASYRRDAPWSQALERVKLADSLGYETVYTTHIAGRESLTVLTAYAQASKQIMIGSGVVPIYSRTPATMAQTAVTMDELSGGRHAARPGRLPSPRGRGAGTARRSTGRSPRCANTWGSCARCSRARTRRRARSGGPAFTLPASTPAQRAADLHRRPLPRDAAPRRRNRRRRDPLALQPQLHRGGGGTRAGGGRDRAGRDAGGVDIVAAVPGALTEDRGAA